MTPFNRLQMRKLSPLRKACSTLDKRSDKRIKYLPIDEVGSQMIYESIMYVT